MFYFLGIDIGGKDNTWVIVLEKRDSGWILKPELSLDVSEGRSVALSEILDFAFKNKVLGVAIDAPLSFSVNCNSGLRKSDLELKKLLKQRLKGAERWVVSYNTLMGIPLRSFLLAEKLAPICGAIIETHPRAGLFFLTCEKEPYLAVEYKKSKEALKKAKEFMFNKFNIESEVEMPLKEGLIDALVCSITIGLYFYAPERLIFLPAEELRGFGPFVVLAPFKF